MKRTIRDYGKNNDLTSAEDVAKMLNAPTRQPNKNSWASFRVAIVLPPISHEYEPVSEVKNIKR